MLAVCCCCWSSCRCCCKLLTAVRCRGSPVARAVPLLWAMLQPAAVGRCMVCVQCRSIRAAVAGIAVSRIISWLCYCLSSGGSLPYMKSSSTDRWRIDLSSAYANICQVVYVLRSAWSWSFYSCVVASWRAGGWLADRPAKELCAVVLTTISFFNNSVVVRDCTRLAISANALLHAWKGTLIG